MRPVQSWVTVGRQQLVFFAYEPTFFESTKKSIFLWQFYHQGCVPACDETRVTRQDDDALQLALATKPRVCCCLLLSRPLYDISLFSAGDTDLPVATK